MSISIFWQIDTAADAHRSERSASPLHGKTGWEARQLPPNRFDYYTQIAKAAAQTHFDGVYLPYSREADETRIAAATVARAVPRIAVIPEFPASVGSAVYAAKQAATFQRSTHGRLGWSIAPPAGAATRASEGDFIAEDDLGERLEEFIIVARGVYGASPFSFSGKHFEVKDGGFTAPLNIHAFPRLYLQGESEEDLAISARHADVHLFRPAPVETLARRIEALDELAKRHNRSVAFGLLQPILVRERAEEIGLVEAQGPLPSGVIAGACDDAAERLAALARLGISHFILSASWSLEECYRTGQNLLPRLRALTDTRSVAA